jgi:hypothetical protein
MAIGDPPGQVGTGGRYASVGGVVVNSYGMALQALRAAEQYFSMRAGGEEKDDGNPD